MVLGDPLSIVKDHNKKLTIFIRVDRLPPTLQEKNGVFKKTHK